VHAHPILGTVIELEGTMTAAVMPQDEVSAYFLHNILVTGQKELAGVSGM